MNLKRITKDQKLTIQLFLAVILVIAGLLMLAVGMFIHPIGEIHNSVLVAAGEVFSFSGCLLGIDYRYRYLLSIGDKKDK